MGCCHTKEEKKIEAKVELLDDDINNLDFYKPIVISGNYQTDSELLVTENNIFKAKENQSKIPSLKYPLNRSQPKDEIKEEIEQSKRKESESSAEVLEEKDINKDDEIKPKFNLKLKLKDETTKPLIKHSKHKTVNSYLATNNLFCIKSIEESNHYPSNKALSVLNETKIEKYDSEIKEKFQFDSYDHSREIFNCINDIRISPYSYVDILENLIKKVNTEGEIEYLQLEDFGSLFYGKYILKNKKSGLMNLLSFLKLNRDKSYEPIIWSEKVFNGCVVGIINLNGLHLEYSDEEGEENKIEKNYFEKTNIKFKNQIISILEGGFPCEISALILLSEEQTHIRESLITDNFDLGACCFSLNETEYPKGILYLLFGIRKQKEDRLLENPIIQSELDLDNSIFDNIQYKDEIMSGEFKVDNGILTAMFILENGSTKIERIVLK